MRWSAPASGVVGLAASIASGCTSPGWSAGADWSFDAGSEDAASSGAHWTVEGGVADSRSGDAESGAPVTTAAPPSCSPGGDGLTNCGASRESCCASLEVAGGTFERTYTISGGAPSGAADPAGVSSFRLDKYLVTVGRFRRFVGAVAGGYAPAAGSGKHTHLNGGKGLGAAGGGYEQGWASPDDAQVAPTDLHLACHGGTDSTWTSTPGSRETFPINCVSWYEAVAFCVWDGGFLPSESEWEYAAAGGSQEREYPWGATDPGAANEYAIYDCNYPAGSGRCTGGAAPVGTATLGAALWGQLDLAGNVNEWNADWFAAYVHPCVDCAYLTPATYRVLRGGYFYNDPSYLLSASRSDDLPTVRSICIGFRCARTPQSAQ